MKDFSEDQQLAIKGALDAMAPGKKSTNPYRLVGNAGTGKTEVLTQISRDASAVTLTPTNKAAAVLRARGVPAVTIHSQIYAPEQVSLKEDLAAAEEALAASVDESDRMRLQSTIDELEERLSKTPKGTRMRFSFRPDNNLKGRNVIIDEASMVGKRTLGDVLLSNPLNVLLVGDPGQLPPINQEDSLRCMPPNWMLSTQHRTGDAKELADLANLVRTQGAQSAWDHAVTTGIGPVETMTRGAFLKERLALADLTDTGECIWLCWRNQTRLDINKGIRQRLKRDWKCAGMHDRLVAYKKDPGDDARWHNGSSALVVDVLAEEVPVIDDWSLQESKGRELMLEIDGSDPTKVSIAYGDFMPDWSRDSKPTWQYGYCLTVHKAQGSEWDTVVVADDYKGRRGENDQRQWLYTALTRARKRVVWIR